MRASILALALLALSCGGDDTVDPFVLQLIASDGSSSDAIVQAAVTDIVVIIDPDDNVDFEPAMPVTYELGANARIDSAGQWVLRLPGDWIERNAYALGSTFAVDVPLYQTGEIPEVDDPTLNVLFIQRDDATGEEVVIGEFRRFLAWPIQHGETIAVTVDCLDGLRFQCLNQPPP